MLNHDALFSRACGVIPGGVNSPVRAFNAVGGTPLYVTSAKGAALQTADGRALTDFCCSWGAMILGHAQDEVVDAVCAQAGRGTSYGINTPQEVTFAERLCALVPGLDQVRLVNSGTEAVMTALRIARGVTGRKRIVKFEGCYHGHSDSVLVNAGSGLLTGGSLSSLGISRHVASDTFVVPFNNLDAVNELIREKGAEIAAMIVEPLPANMGLILPDPGFLSGLRKAADRCGALLIFDEVIDGFRFRLSSYASAIGVTPDLFTLGKVIGGGLPLAAVGGAAVFMEQLAPQGKVYQAGTLSGNPLAVAAGLQTLAVLEREDPYPRMAELGDRMAAIINAGAAERRLALHCAHNGGVFTLFCRQAPVRDLADARQCDTAAYARLFHALLARGWYLPPAQFEVGFISAAHREEEVTRFAADVLDVLT